MSKQANQKSKLLLLERIFCEETDENTRLTLDEIITRLGDNGVQAERKSVYSDIETLRKMDIDIVAEKSGRTTVYYQASRIFEQPELDLLANAVACAKFITDKKSRMLIEKISALASPSGKKSLKRQIIVSDRIKTMNEHIYYSIDKIGEAINSNRKIAVLYYSYDRTQKQKYHNDGKPMIVSPYSLTWKDENYYCVCYSEKHSVIVSLRVDRMDSVELLNEKRVVVPDFNATEYSKQLFGMYGGKTERVTLRFDNSLAGVVIDRFGLNTKFRLNDESFDVTVKLAVSLNFYGWLFQFGKKAEIVSPEWVREDFEKSLKGIIKKYKK